jgi:hypothetical protein
MTDVLIIPNIMLRRDRKWNGGLEFIVRIGRHGEQKGENPHAIF